MLLQCFLNSVSVGWFCFCFKRRVCILQDCDVTSVFLSLGGRKHVQLRGFQKSFSDLKLKKLDRLSWDM